MTTGRRARDARWRRWDARLRWGRTVGRLVRGALLGLLALGASGQETTGEPVPSADPAVAMWLEVRDTDDRALLVAFIDAFPDSPYAHAAHARLKRLEGPPAAAEDRRAPARKRRRSR